MRLAILAFDGLEYALVDLWKKALPYLTQKKYGYFESMEEITTPFLWATIITGAQDPRNALKEYTWSYPANPVLRFIWKHFRFLRGKGLGKKLRIRRQFVDKKWLTEKSIFDEYKSLVINFPAYNWSLPDVVWRWSLTEVIGDEERSRTYYQAILENDSETLRKALRFLEREKDWDIFAVWFYFTDIVNHLYGKNRVKLFTAYLRANKFAKKLIKAIGNEDTVIVIMSDHGGLRGIHTTRAFISVNRENIAFPRNIKEVYHFFKEILKS